MRIIGLHDGHNASACLLHDGQLLAAVQEERLTRIKNHDIFPLHAIQWLLELAGVGWSEIDAVALNGQHQPVHRDRQQLIQATRWGGSRRPENLLRRWARATPALSLWKNRRRRQRLSEAAAAGIDPTKLQFIDHHACHAAAAYWGSPFRGKPVLVLTADGAGDDLCATASLADPAGRLQRLATVDESHSPALVYLTVTTLMGMVPNEHEYKLMGMAPYAQPEAAEEVCRIFEGLLEWDPAQPLAWRRRSGVPSAYYLYDYLKARLDMRRFDSICGGLQLWVERLLTEWVRRAIGQTGIRRLALSGGIFMNVKANQAIAALPELEELFIYPSCGDETNAMGAAYAAYEQRRASSSPLIEPLGPFYLGPQASEQEIVQALQQAAPAIRFEKPAEMATHAAAFLARGEVVARFCGRAEFGARALGNRSILAHPGRPEVIRTINEMIKCRDFWMPFACSVLSERQHDYVRNPKQIPAPYMILTFDTTERAGEIAAGTHPYDQTVRPQVVEQSWNPGYHALIKAFEQETGTGALLNTSFNLHGHPIVNTPAEAIDVLLRSGLKYLILGDYWVEKSGTGAAHLL